MNTIYSNKWVERIIVAIQKAYKEIKPLIGTEKAKKQYSVGAGGDITLEIDIRAENSIIKSLESYDESIIVISEEIGEYFWNPISKTRIKKFNSVVSSNYFIIDPVDGSTNSKRGIPYSCISIAYANGPTINDIQIGVILNIATQDLYVAEKGRGAFCNNKPIICSQAQNITESIGGTDIHIREFCVHDINEKYSILRDAKKVRIMGSSALSLCLVAEGALDFYIDFRGISRICDFAAAFLIVQEAGGFFIGEIGQPLSLDNLSLTQRFTYLAGCSGLEDKIKEKIK